MKKRKIFSPYYDFKSFQYNNPYLTSPTAGRPKKVATAEDKVTRRSHGNSSEGRRCSSHEILEGRRVEPGSGDASAKKLQQSGDDLGDSIALQELTKSSQTSPQLRRSPRRVPSQNFFSLNQQMLNRKARESQNTLRYLLKLSNNTFYATLKHEIDTLKKKESNFQQELNLQSLSILKILKNQKNSDEALEKIINQNQRFEEEFREKGDLLCRLIDRVQLLNFSVVPLGQNGSQKAATMLKSHSHPNPPTIEREPLQPPRSAPSMIPRRKKIKKQVRVQSEPAIINRSELSCRNDGEGDSESDLLTNLSAGCTDLASELDISCSKNVSWESSKVCVDQRTVGTNYSANDFSAPSDTTCSTKSYKKRRPWYDGLFCCK